MSQQEESIVLIYLGRAAAFESHKENIAVPHAPLGFYIYLSHFSTTCMKQMWRSEISPGSDDDDNLDFSPPLLDPSQITLKTRNPLMEKSLITYKLMYNDFQVLNT